MGYQPGFSRCRDFDSDQNCHVTKIVTVEISTVHTAERRSALRNGIERATLRNHMQESCQVDARIVPGLERFAVRNLDGTP